MIGEKLLMLYCILLFVMGFFGKFGLVGGFVMNLVKRLLIFCWNSIVLLKLFSDLSCSSMVDSLGMLCIWLGCSVRNICVILLVGMWIVCMLDVDVCLYLLGWCCSRWYVMCWLFVLNLMLLMILFLLGMILFFFIGSRLFLRSWICIGIVRFLFGLWNWWCISILLLLKNVCVVSVCMFVMLNSLFVLIFL